MAVSMEISARGLRLSAPQERAIRQRIDQLGRFDNRILECRVLVDAPERHRRRGAAYRVRIDLTRPNGEVVVTRRTGETVRTAVQEAFAAARRRLQDRMRLLQGAVKVHAPSPQGRVARLFPYEGYGFLKSADGREVYFHANAVLNGAFERLEPGTKVRFVESLGEKGPQASTVEIAGPHRAG